jgi:hypothetical protein
MDDEISVNVVLASGRGTCLSVLPSSSIGELKAAAAQEFGQGFLKLLTADCRLGAAFMSLFKLFIWRFPKQKRTLCARAFCTVFLAVFCSVFLLQCFHIIKGPQ